MVTSRHVSWLLGAALALVASPGEAAAPPRPWWPLDAASRPLLDAFATGQEPTTLVEERVRLIGTVPAFLLERLQLPAEVELRRSREVHHELLRRERALLTPAAAAAILDRLAKEVPAYQRP